MKSILLLTLLLSFYKAYAQEKIHSPEKLFVFVGEQIEVSKFTPILPDNVITLDMAYKAKYKIIQF